MTPIKFAGSNVVFGEDQPEYIPLPAYVSSQGHVVTTCWVFTWTERLRLLLTGRVYVRQLTFGKPLQAQALSVEMPPCT